MDDIIISDERISQIFVTEFVLRLSVGLLYHSKKMVEHALHFDGAISFIVRCEGKPAQRFMVRVKHLLHLIEVNFTVIL